jgi:two-component system CheB/CheR fusion protein
MKKAAIEFPVVGIGASAGGIAALRRFFEHMPVDSGMAFVVILHLSEQYESNLAEILQKATRMPVGQVTSTLKVEPNQVYVIPPAKQLIMAEGFIRVTDSERPGSTNADRSLLPLAGRRLRTALGGNQPFRDGLDGTLGFQRIKECGGITLLRNLRSGIRRYAQRPSRQGS